MGKGTDAENGSLLGYRQGAELQSESGAVSSDLPGERRSPAGQQRCGTEYQKILCREVGQKSWQISATKNGAEASGILYSIAETARANGLRPYYYFKHVLETMIPHMDDKTTDFLEELMPWSESLPEVCRSKEK